MSVEQLIDPEMSRAKDRDSLLHCGRFSGLVLVEVLVVVEVVLLVDVVVVVE